MVKPLPRLKLQGFNNLTKSLSFNIYDVCYAASEGERGRYIEYIDEEYNADRLTQILADAITDRQQAAIGDTGLKFVFDGVKTGVKGQYGQNSTQYAAVKGIKW